LLAIAVPQVHGFEREIAEQCGVVPEDIHGSSLCAGMHPITFRPAGTLRRRTERTPSFRWRVKKCTKSPSDRCTRGSSNPATSTSGARRAVLFLEIMLGYQHRGVEPLLERLGRDRGVLVAESIAGDTVIGHAGAYCGVVEALARSRKTPRGQAVRGITLELERVANHIGDLGAIAADVAFQPAAAYLGRMRGDCLNLLMMLSGNRYGRGSSGLGRGLRFHTGHGQRDARSVAAPR
jgi:hypothetical protein